MALEQLVDCFNVAIGACDIARGGTFTRSMSRQDIVSQGDAVPGDYAIDGGPVNIQVNLTAQDPLVVPTVLGLSFPAVVTATGRLKNAATYRKHGVSHGVLTAASLDLVDLSPGTCSFNFQNRAVAESDTLDDEAPTAVGSAAGLVSRNTTIRIVAATFTPKGGVAINVLGLSRVSWSAQAMVVPTTISPGSGTNFVDAVDIVGWRVSGTLTMLDTALTGQLSAAQCLAGQVRGDLAVRCRQSSYAEAAAPPTDQIVTFKYLKLKNPSEGLQTKSDGTGSLQFDALLRDGVTLKPIGELVTVADAE